MNIFILDSDVQRCAQAHCDKHVVKMILETTQLLNNAMIVGQPDYIPVYRQTHKNHPCSLWACESRDNFIWLLSLGAYLCDEYTFRYEKTHKCKTHLDTFATQINKLVLPVKGLTPFRLCMPDQYKVEDPVESYRNYYRGDKVKFAKWTRRPEPEWWTNNVSS